MRTRVTGFFLKSILILLFAVLAFYFLAVFTYRSEFSYGTRINGINCAGMSVPEVSGILLADYPVSDITLSFPDGTEETLKADSIGVSVNFESELLQIRYAQNPFLWGLNLFEKEREETVSPTVSFDKDRLKATVEGLKFVKEHDPKREMHIEIVAENGTYSLTDTTGPSVNADYVFEHVYGSLCKGRTDISIPETFLIEHEYTEEEKKTLSLWAEINEFSAPGLVYDMGDELEEFDRDFLMSLLYYENGRFLRDEEGHFFFDRERLIQGLHSFLDAYDTYEMPRTFVNVNGETKTLERNYYGTLIDREAEEEYLLYAVSNGIREKHIPEYIKEPYHRGLDDIGPTRLEIDLTRQKLYFIKDGSIDVESDIVTGNPRTGHATNEMVTTVLKKETDTYLRGEGYRSFVHYWIAVYKNTIGIHDASWQKEFGGERYLTHGSKGCINAPDDIAADLYSKVEIGMPVLIYK